jgi:DNA-binding beta-propeller fold protein YncE
VHYPVTEKRPAGSTTIVYDAARNRVYNVNQDNDSISVVDPEALTKVGELAVYKDPEALALAPNGKLWVLHRDDYAIAIVDPDTLQIERGFRLPYASQPIGLVMSPTGDAAYVTLMALGKLLKLDPATGEVKGEVAVGPTPRGVSVSADGKRIFVTRFISATTGGEVVEVDATTLMVSNRFLLAPDTTTNDTDQKGRGLPNFLFSVGLSPDAREAWIPGNKDNIFRGVVDGLPMTQDNTVRPMVAVLDLLQGGELLEKRIDLDDRNLPSHVEFSPLGDYAFVTLTASNLIEVRDSYTRVVATTLTDAGLAPRGTVLGPKNRLFVQGSMERSVVVYDMTGVLDWSVGTAKRLTDIPVVTTEKLAPEVLLGKQVFSNAADGRMTKEGYLTCITCHFDGGEDGRVYDFTSRGEGLRNTISLRGHRGIGQGNLLWSGAFDEVQDFEEEIRGLFVGSGFIADDALASGTHSQALGDPKKGLSKELDAVAAYLTTLDHVNPSPFRNPDGTMTADGVAGKELFSKLGCDFCHSGPDFTDSGRGRLHDVGTIKAKSGTRGGGPLLGLDTPSLVGVWETPPYLHDGSAPTLRDVLTTANANDQHGFVSSLSAVQVDQLVSFLQQLDGDQQIRRLPFEPALPSGGAGGVGGGGAGGVGGDAMLPIAGGGTGATVPPPKHQSSCSFGPTPRVGGEAWLWLAPLWFWYRRRRQAGGAS